ncbi:MAG: cupin [Candidatus Pacebacteria bacterium RIFOXYB1_FULL_39_46]|nr:MAG: cupin [Candidatus Pacebacteria bacterium RIFOXYB1_FULL_39_46]OGJ39107.1 MAG: cupin [Candidatus Pacebacteria bacterium RIFOXYA1_FULL_38_18]OGJ40193.1 MAG: cupin [Candidatus Pacebacteria bacterium RIFOXYD1_FULL_39_27]OGJ41076.1 MAG: cupin [Candidatus Pacebacteria bacterium RIFOXYC1_FULL_39_21]
MKIGYLTNIKKATLANPNFRQVLFTGQHLQLVLMSLLPNEEISLETHQTTDQFFRVEAGEGKVIINGETQSITDDDVIIIPAGAEHNIINTSAERPLKLYTIYAPPHHKDGTIHQTKKDAEMDEEDHL